MDAAETRELTDARVDLAEVTARCAVTAFAHSLEKVIASLPWYIRLWWWLSEGWQSFSAFDEHMRRAARALGGDR